ncbi:hypothetical protein BCR42DRAFT_485706 [Absidia repens]|uniref:Myb-like domain-containing protein n=1 Tax=Absidia repens TaxID=90262 RepID=A0A1X2J174_9FUNG|nr:hypothetical protein BCR42DRAFT_485706 [Absidia repens]
MNSTVLYSTVQHWMSFSITSAMDLKHILCQPMEEDLHTKNSAEMVQSQEPLGNDRTPQQTYHVAHQDYWQHGRPTSMNSLSTSTSTSSTLIGRTNSMTGNGVHPYLTSPRRRVHSEQQYRISPVFSLGYHQQHHCPDEVLIAPLTSMSVSIQIQTRTPWTPAEDILLQKGYEQGLSWAMISATHLPHRSRGCCWGRFKTLQSKNLIHVKVQQNQSRLARRAWKAMSMTKKPTSSTSA